VSRIGPLAIRRLRTSLAVCIVWTLLAIPGVASLEVNANDEVQVLALGSSTGLNAFSPDRWGVVSVTVANSSDEPATVRASVNLKTAPDLRFSRDVWLPARSTRTASIPVHLPPDFVGEKQFEISRRVVSGAKISESLDATTLLPIALPGATAFIKDYSFEGDEAESKVKDPSYEVVLAMRQTRGYTRTLTTPTERLLPSTVEGWEPVGHVVVAGKRLSTEPGAATALRGWVSEGGRMWIQLNRSDIETVRALFGSAVQMTIVDRVPLTTFELTEPISGTRYAEVEHEEPVELIRAHVEGATVNFRVDQWPAAIEFPYGRGRVLITLLDAHGWMRPHDQSDPPYTDPLLYTDFRPLEPLQDLAARMFEPAVTKPLERDAIATYVSDRIGYQVPSRGAVFTVLLIFCGVIFAGGMVLASRQRLEHLSWMAAIAAVVATSVLVIAGWTRRGEVEPTIAEFRMVDFSPDTGDYTSSGLVAVYQPEQVRADFKSRSTRIDPEMPELSGQIRDFVWVEGDSWQWNDTRLPPGVTLLNTEEIGSVAGPVRASATFGPSGLEGRLVMDGLTVGPGGEGNGATDVAKLATDNGLILFPNASPFAMNLSADGSFTSGEGDRLADGQFTNSTLVNDEQRRRQAVLDRWWAQQGTSGMIKRPAALVWLDHWATAIRSDQAVQRIGASMVRVPLEIVRPPAGTKVAIPSNLIRTTSVAGQAGQSSAFDSQTETWSEINTQAAQLRLRFQIPDQALPLSIESARLVLQCNIPSRVLEVHAVSGDRRTQAGRISNPSGQIVIDLQEAGALELDPQGGLLVDISVSDLQSGFGGSSVTNGWNIRSSRLEVSGITQPDQPESNE
jgi:hypothetical protein